MVQGEDAGAGLVAVVHAPVAQRVQYGFQTGAFEWLDVVDDVWGDLPVDGAADDPVGFEFAELLGEHLLAEGGDEAPQLAVPARGLEQVEQQNEFPFPAEHLDRGVDGALIDGWFRAHRGHSSALEPAPEGVGTKKCVLAARRRWACDSSMTLSETTSGEPRRSEAVIERVEGDRMAVNSYLVHGPEGLVVVDAQLTVSDAEKVRAAVVAGGRRLAGVLITHPHPDHYAGAGLVAGDAPILATPEVAAVIRRDDEEKAAIVGAMMGPEWPVQRRFPDRLVNAGDTVELAGLRFRVTESGPGESHADTLWWLDDRTVFAGDIAYNRMHAYLADAQHAGWLAALAALEDQLADDTTLYVGHGEPTDKSILSRQRGYIETFLTAVEEHAGDDPTVRQRAVVDRMRAIEPDERLRFLMELSVEPVHTALAGGVR